MKIITQLLLSLQIILIIIPQNFSLEVELECKTINKSRDKVCSNNKIVVNTNDTAINLKSEGSEFKILLVQQTVVEYLPTKINEAFPNLQSLRVVNCSLKEIERTNFVGLEAIKEVDFQKNFITKLQPDTFELLENLEKLNLDHNQISALPSKIFFKNTKLTDISLAHNSIGQIHDETFKTLTNLQHIYLASNKIEDLRGGTFDNCVKLTRFVVNNNKLKYVPANIFEKNENLKISQKNFQNNTCIDASDRELKNMDDLKEILLEHCKPPNQGLIDELKQKIDDLNIKITDITEKYEKQNNTLEEVKADFQICDKKLRGKDEETKKIQDEKNKIEEDLKTCKSEAEKSKQNLTSSNKELEEKFKETQENLRTCMENNSTYHTKLTKLEEDVTKCTNAKNHLLEIWSTCESSLRQKNEEYVNITKDLDVAQESIRVLTKELAEKNETVIKNSREIDNLRIEISQKQFMINSLYEKLSNSNNSSSCTSNSVLFDISCNFDTKNCKSSNNNTFYTCSIVGLKKINCNSKLNDISDIPRGTTIEGLSFNDTFLTEFPTKMTKKYKNLKYLEIIKSGFGEFDSDICGLSSDFEFIFISTSFIGDAVKIDKCTSLKDLWVENSEIRQVTAANPIDSLINLIIKNNQVEHVSKEFFEQFKNLRNVQMGGNKITQLKSNIFDKNQALTFIGFADNPITTIDGEIFARNSNLKIVNFENLECINRQFKSKELKELSKIISEKCK